MHIYNVCSNVWWYSIIPYKYKTIVVTYNITFHQVNFICKIHIAFKIFAFFKNTNCLIRFDLYAKIYLATIFVICDLGNLNILLTNLEHIQLICNLGNINQLNFTAKITLSNYFIFQCERYVPYLHIYCVELP